MEPPKMKRPRSGSISNRLRSASVLCEQNNLDKDAKGALKDLIIRDDPDLRPLMARIEAGDSTVLREMIDAGTLRLGGQHSDDLLGEDGDLNLDFLNVGDVDVGSVASDQRDDLLLGDDEEDGGGQFEFSFNDENDDFSPGNLSGTVPMPYKQEPRSRRPVPRPSSLVAPDVKPIPVNSAAGQRDRGMSFGAPLMEVFGMDMFDDPNAPHVPYSPMSHSPSRSMGSVGSGALQSGSGPNYLMRPGSNLSGSNMLNRPLHRDSIGCVEDILANNSAGRGPNSYGSSGFPGFDSLDASDMIGEGGNERLSSLSSLSSFSALRSGGRTARTRSGGIATLPPQPHQSQYDTRNRGRVPGRPGEAQAKASAPVPIEQPPAFVYKPDPANINQTGFVGGYSPDSRRRRIEKFLQKRQNRVWMKKVKYDVRKNFADSRLRVKGRFVRKEDEQMLRELVAMTL
ncbi:Zinc finger protein CONSTANS [Hondaea fermentalgiana]|uniref:Zinc finger protein CONSTANS n=1 Tax=Hondaea fermentalgiana TaxID=2315210 RepID=A0A2R5GDR6_9STRA|nr:Zinc finger protein CONSTANS [Hondaea fermentalgiana]|eukprot:GBG25944.1 Zinc finger protein CONSTANS [Hondaea fermentalgiana]